jgi:hypothetical protein
MTLTHRNYTLKECDARLAQYVNEIVEGRMRFWQKFTCDNCFERITVDEPNKLFITGHCQLCGHVTDLQKMGCNYSVMLSRGRLP